MKGQLTVQDLKKGTILPVSAVAQHAAVWPIADHTVQSEPAGALTGSRFGQDFSQVAVHAEPAAARSELTPSCPLTPTRCPFGGACHTCPVQVQTKLAINQPGDKYEQEADRAAAQVTRTPGAQLQRRAASQVQPTTVPPIVHEVLLSPGQPLDTATRACMEPRFAHDFSRVRVHTDAQAAESAQAVNALAYTVGRDVVFGTGQHAPRASAGKELMAHELTHVVQQGGREYSDGSLAIGDANGSSEHEAETIADQVLRYGTVLAVHAADPAVPEEVTGDSFQAGISGRPASMTNASLVIRRQSTPVVQHRAHFNVLVWDATKLGPPTPTNGADPRYIDVPPTGQISVSALVEVQGAATDPCADYEIGTAQTAWAAWTVAHYQGQNPGDGRVTVRHRASMPMRDPSPAGSVWYDSANVRKPGSCGDSVGIFHTDSPWHSIPKARNNSKAVGNPLNYLRSYTRGLHLVTYLTARDPGGVFLVDPLRFVYWNSLQDFAFVPNFVNPLSMWAHTGQVKVNIGAQGHGLTADAPYFTTAGPNFNAHFGNSANWDIDEQR